MHQYVLQTSLSWLNPWFVLSAMAISRNKWWGSSSYWIEYYTKTVHSSGLWLSSMLIVNCNNFGSFIWWQDKNNSQQPRDHYIKRESKLTAYHTVYCSV